MVSIFAIISALGVFHLGKRARRYRRSLETQCGNRRFGSSNADRIEDNPRTLSIGNARRATMYSSSWRDITRPQSRASRRLSRSPRKCDPAPRKVRDLVPPDPRSARPGISTKSPFPDFCILDQCAISSDDIIRPTPPPHGKRPGASQPPKPGRIITSPW